MDTIGTHKLPDVEWRLLQQNLLDEISIEPGDNKIIWYYDEIP